ncbi:MAG: shikimate kinase [Thaumarchaeota archaeon]|jgi:shikimate kinase|nr:shikimate kinase [Candidatus Geocrenenecus arthurdayi]
MKTRAIVHGAVSIVNAIPTGLGAALGIDLTTIVEAELFESNKRELDVEIKLEDEEVEDTVLLEKVVDKLLNIVGEGKAGIHLDIYSNIPVARGLKSSSAVSDAVVLAVSKLLGVGLNLIDAVNLAVDACIEAGVSITGAFDDAVTCMIGGVNITDNYQREILTHWSMDEDLSILISIPEEKKYTRELNVEIFKNIRNLSSRAVTLALNGLIWDAMIINGFIIASALDIDYRPMLAALRKNILACGVSGKGPAIVAVTTPEYEDEVEREFKNFGKTLKAKPNNKIAEVKVLE